MSTHTTTDSVLDELIELRAEKDASTQAYREGSFRAAKEYDYSPGEIANHLGITPKSVRFTIAAIERTQADG